MTRRKAVHSTEPVVVKFGRAIGDGLLEVQYGIDGVEWLQGRILAIPQPCPFPGCVSRRFKSMGEVRTHFLAMHSGLSDRQRSDYYDTVRYTYRRKIHEARQTGGFVVTWTPVWMDGRATRKQARRTPVVPPGAMGQRTPDIPANPIARRVADSPEQSEVTKAPAIGPRVTPEKIARALETARAVYLEARLLHPHEEITARALKLYQATFMAAERAAGADPYEAFTRWRAREAMVDYFAGAHEQVADHFGDLIYGTSALTAEQREAIEVRMMTMDPGTDENVATFGTPFPNPADVAAYLATRQLSVAAPSAPPRLAPPASP